MIRKTVMANRCNILLAIILFSPLYAYLQTEVSDTTAVQQSSLILKLNTQYQSKIGSKTIHRCPFEVSCSHFLTASIKNHGPLKGTALFLDRYFYRENMDIPSHYEAVVKNNRLVYNDEIPDSLIAYIYNH